MQLQALSVYHLSKNTPSFPSVNFPSSVFQIDTCQRTVWIWNEEDMALASQITDSQNYSYGVDAYLFLLRFACGLMSPVLGETDVFGQIKEAWKQFKQTQNQTQSSLSSWIQNL